MQIFSVELTKFIVIMMIQQLYSTILFEKTNISIVKVTIRNAGLTKNIVYVHVIIVNVTLIFAVLTVHPAILQFFLLIITKFILIPTMSISIINILMKAI